MKTMATQQCEVEVRQFVFKSHSGNEITPCGLGQLRSLQSVLTPSVHTQVWCHLHSLVGAWQAQITPGSWLTKPLLRSQSLSVIAGWTDGCSQSAPAMDVTYGWMLQAMCRRHILPSSALGLQV